jgi:hypothetical protein
MSAQEQIKEYLKHHYPDVFSSGSLQKMEWKNADSTTATPAIVQRRLRNLEELSIIAVRYTGKKNTAEYRYLQTHERANYIPTADRTDLHQIWKDTEAVQQNKYVEELQEEITNGNRVMKLVKRYV